MMIKRRSLASNIATIVCCTGPAEGNVGLNVCYFRVAHYHTRYSMLRVWNVVPAAWYRWTGPNWFNAHMVLVTNTSHDECLRNSPKQPHASGTGNIHCKSAHCQMSLVTISVKTVSWIDAMAQSVNNQRRHADITVAVSVAV